MTTPRSAKRQPAAKPAAPKGAGSHVAENAVPYAVAPATANLARDFRDAKKLYGAIRGAVDDAAGQSAAAAALSRLFTAAGAQTLSHTLSAITRDPDPAYYRAVLEAGIPARAVGKFAALIGKSKEEVFERIGISRATAHRLEAAGRGISPLESDAFADMAGVVQQAREMLGGDDALLRQWIDAPVPALGSRSPWAALADLRGRREVRRLLDIIAAGTFA